MVEIAKPDGRPEVEPAAPAKVELITGVGQTAMVEVDPAQEKMQTVGGYSNIKSPVPGTRYETGMPIQLDAGINPQAGDPQVPKLH